MHAQFMHALAHGLRIAKIAKLGAADAFDYPRLTVAILQRDQPGVEGIGLEQRVHG